MNGKLVVVPIHRIGLFDAEYFRVNRKLVDVQST